MDGLYHFFENNSIYVVLTISLIVWFGIFFYLKKLDKRLEKLNNSIKEVSNE